MQVTEKWWPGCESNTRHADFQGGPSAARNPLSPLDVCAAKALGISDVMAAFDREFAGFQPVCPTADIKSGAL